MISRRMIYADLIFSIVVITLLFLYFQKDLFTTLTFIIGVLLGLVLAFTHIVGHQQ